MTTVVNLKGCTKDLTMTINKPVLSVSGTRGAVYDSIIKGVCEPLRWVLKDSWRKNSSRWQNNKFQRTEHTAKFKGGSLIGTFEEMEWLHGGIWMTRLVDSTVVECEWKSIIGKGFELLQYTVRIHECKKGQCAWWIHGFVIRFFFNCEQCVMWRDVQFA